MDNIIIQIMKLSGQNLSQIARIVGIDRSYLTKMKNGTKEISGKNENLLRYCYKDILGINIEHNNEDIIEFEKIKQQQIKINNSIGNPVVNVMRRFNITQTQMAVDTKISREYLSKLASGSSEISEKIIKKLKKVYGNIGVEDISINEIDNKEVFINNNSDKMYPENKENLGLNEASVHSIIKTNRNISRAIDKIADTNAQFAILLKNIIPSKTETYQGVHQDVLSKMSQMLEYLVEVGAGKRWETKEDGILELNTRFFGSSQVLKEKDTQSVKGN